MGFHKIRSVSADVAAIRVVAERSYNTVRYLRPAGLQMKEPSGSGSVRLGSRADLSEPLCTAVTLFAAIRGNSWPKIAAIGCDLPHRCRNFVA
jgi:hypothetical protein